MNDNNSFSTLARYSLTLALALCGAGCSSNVPQRTFMASGSIEAVWAGSATDAWAIGSEIDNSPGVTQCSDGGYEKGYMVHWDGTAWSDPIVTPEVEQFTAVSGTSGSDIWALGHDCNNVDVMYHYDGTHWSVGYVGTNLPLTVHLGAIVTVSATDAWAIGSGQPINGRHVEALLHWDGAQWSQTSDPALADVGLGDIVNAGTAGVFLYGNSVGLFRFDGSHWVRVWAGELPAYSELFAGGNELWLSEQDGVYRWNGTDFSTRVGEAWEGWNDGPVWGSSASDIWAINGRSATGYYCGRISDLQVCGTVKEYLAHWDGTRWSFFETGQDTTYRSIVGVAGGPIWFVNYDGIDRLN